MAKVDWKKVVHKALGFLIHEGEKEVSAAVRRAIDAHGIHPSQVSVEQYDHLKDVVSTVHAALEADV
jgi:hypothetical protein